MKKIISLILTIILVAGISVSSVSAQSEIRVLLNGNTIEFDQSPVIINDRTMVPMRSIYESMGAEVSWDAKARIASGTLAGVTVAFIIDKAVVYINGNKKEIDSPATIVNGRTLIPVRALAEGFGIDVEWDADERIIHLRTSGEIDSDAPTTIACWGDSLTEGLGGEGVTYPDVLAELTGYTVYNMGISSETSYTIAARQGAHKIVTKEEIVIPMSTVAVEIEIETEEGGIVVPRSSAAWGACTLAGVEGTLSISLADTWLRTLDRITFTRSVPGERVVVPAGTQLIPEDSLVEADINIFFSGTNGGWNKYNLEKNDDSDEMCQELADLIQSQVDHTGESKYIVIGLTWGTVSSNDNVNAHLAAQFGDNFLNVREYLATEKALEDAGITPTEEDHACIAAGKIPPSLLLEDQLHFTAEGYRLIAQQVYEKMVELGYCEEN